MGLFSLQAPFSPTGDQPEAIRELERGVRDGSRFQTLLGVTGSGKTYTMANVIAELERPTLIFSHNKTLAAQLYGELKGFFPQNAVEYFISYYDYYQPEAFIPQTNTYIEKDTSINDEIERLRLRATSSLLARRDVVVVCSVSAIYGLGNPRTFREGIIHLEHGQELDRDDLLQLLVDSTYQRNDVEPDYGTFRVRGDVVEVRAAHEERTLRIEFFGDTIDRLAWIDHLSGKTLEAVDSAAIFPASQFITDRGRSQVIVDQIARDLEDQLAMFDAGGQVLEAQRLASRTRYDMEMILQIGHCPGVENYSRYFDDRQPGERPACLLDYFPGRLPADHRREPRHRVADRCHVQRRPLPQGEAGGAWLPPAVGPGQPAAAVRGVRGPRAQHHLRVGHPGRLGTGEVRWRVRRTGHPAHGAGRPADPHPSRGHAGR